MKIDIENIPIEDKIKDFAQYLQSTDRIILSAKFGDGKTYLLNQIRNSSELSKKYKFFTIYPVNYSVSQNEDVFEYIKRDIILQLNKDKLLDKLDLDAVFDSIANFNNLREVISFLLSFVPGGSFYDKVFDKFCEAKKKYEEKEHTADKYLGTFSYMRGGIYEEDGYTKLIRNAIEWIGKDHPNWEKKESVLIIEDLDRLDPAHLFRILNVLSAHIDDTSNPDVVANKFGFHNIVLVMDVSATKHIFHHFYGNEANFEGYMSKFLSREPFYYSIRPYMLLALKREIAKNLKVSNIFGDYFKNFNKRLDAFSIRDMRKIANFDTLERIKENAFIFRKMKFSTSLPLFDLISYMVESGMTAGEIEKDFLSVHHDRHDGLLETRCMEYIRLLYPIFAIKEKEHLECLKLLNKYYNIKLEMVDDVVDSIQVERADSWQNPVIDISSRDIGETIKWCLDNFAKCINLAALTERGV